MTPIERLWAGVDRRGPDDCWPYLGAEMVQWKGSPQRKRRVAWIVTHGEIADGKLVIAKCGFGFCCNPAHLFLGTPTAMGENMLSHGRGTIGERNIHAKLTIEQVREIRRDFKAENKKKTNAKELAGRYGVKIGAIHYIIRGDSWKHVT